MPLLFDPGQSELGRITQNTLLETKKELIMSPMLQWPVLLFAFMMTSFAVTLLGVSIGDSRLDGQS
jgi:hypothetical protein